MFINRAIVACREHGMAAEAQYMARDQASLMSDRALWVDMMRAFNQASDKHREALARGFITATGRHHHTNGTDRATYRNEVRGVIERVAAMAVAEVSDDHNSGAPNA